MHQPAFNEKYRPIWNLDLREWFDLYRLYIKNSALLIVSIRVAEYSSQPSERCQVKTTEYFVSLTEASTSSAVVLIINLNFHVVMSKFLHSSLPWGCMITIFFGNCFVIPHFLCRIPSYDYCLPMATYRIIILDVH